MKGSVIVSVNESPQYRFYLPLITWAWAKFGWNLINMRTCHFDPIDRLILETINHRSIRLESIGDYKSATIAQISRLYASREVNGMIMTSDSDMLPLSDYWQPEENEITSYGWDLTNFQHIPMCFIAMNEENWRGVMRINKTSIEDLIKRDLESLPAKSEVFEEWWSVDQQLITMRLKPLEKTVINRGVLPNGYAYGRVDRSAWSLNHPQLVDCHMLRDIWRNEDHYNKTMELLHHVWPEEDFGWFENYCREFKKLVP